MKVLPILLISLLVVGCQKRADPQRSEALTDAAAAPATKAQAPKSPPATPDASAASSVPMLAYSYEYGLSISSSRLRAVVARHEALCASAGPAQCQVIASSIFEQDEKRISGDLKIRATPAWLSGFRDRLSVDATDAGGRMFRSDVRSEDLSRQIVDTEAALRAKTTLRDRLQQMLATRQGKLADLLDVERELAQVQGEIEATQSELAMMRTRVAMSDVTIRYQSAAALPPNGAWAPISRAVGDMTGIFAMSLAVMLQFGAVIVPWALVVWAIYWAVRRLRPELLRGAGWRRRQTEQPPAT